MEQTPGRHDALCLQLHAGYRCQHAGACCTAGWAIPVEQPVHERLQVHFGGTHGGGELFASGGPPPDGAAAILATDAAGVCVFFEPQAGNLCAIHRELGPRWLPVACRQFPRVVIRDSIATRISLSHFCPTAASLLQSPSVADFAIVSAPDALALDGDVEGLDARHVLPPLLRPEMLTDADGYDAWERRAVGVLATGDVPAEEALELVGTITRRLQSWRPGRLSLRETVQREFDVASAGKPDKDLDAKGRLQGADVLARADVARRSIPHGLPRPSPVDDFPAIWPRVAPWWPDVDGAVRAYLAARLFGNWIAYYGQGLDSIVEYLQVALAVVKMEVARIEVARHLTRETPSSPWQTATAAIRNADLLLVHLSDPRTLAGLLDPNRRA